MNRRPTELPTRGLDPRSDPAESAARPADGQQAAEIFRLPPQGLVFEELERELVRQALERAGYNQTRAARLLGMTRDQIRYRLRKFSLSLPGRSETAA